jgi:hypothetical protein
VIKLIILTCILLANRLAKSNIRLSEIDKTKGNLEKGRKVSFDKWAQNITVFARKIG